MAEKISIIIPVLNESAILKRNLQALQPYRERGHEIIVVDGGSHDNSVAQAIKLVDRIVQTAPGRALQMNEGAEVASHEILLFLHVDTLLPADADRTIIEAVEPEGQYWGHFSLRLSSDRFVFRVIEKCINLRTKITGVATGDQGIFVRRNSFEQVGYFNLIPLMEDVALSKKLRRLARPQYLKDEVISSSRRWEERGIVRTVLLMWYLRAAYFLGVRADILARKY